MLKLIAIYTLAVANLAFAGPLSSRAETAYTETFDTVKLNSYNIPGGQLKDLAGAIPVNISGVYYLAPGARGVVTIGVPPTSGANVGVYLQGQAVIPSITIPQRANVAVTSFDLTSFNFGCVVGGTNKLNPTGVSLCSVVVNGYLNGYRVATQTFKFNPGKVTKANMVTAKFSADFKNIDRAIFGTAYSGSTAGKGVTLIDDLKYITNTDEEVLAE